MGDQVPRWVRIGVAVVLMAPQLLIGLWGLLATKSWYEDFPGVGPDLVASIPPFNEHLAADAAGGFFATGVALLIATIWPRRDLVLMALVTYLAFALPHTIYHSLNEAPGLSGSEDLVNAVNLWAQIVFAGVFLWGAWRSAPTSEG